MRTVVDDELRRQVGRETAALVAESVEFVRERAGECWAVCPFHDEQTPSFSVNQTTGLWKCFGCGERGDGFSWVTKVHGCGFPEAVDFWRRRLGRAQSWARGGGATVTYAPATRATPGPKKVTADPEYDRIFQEVWGEILERCTLHGEARAYLEHRGVDPDFAHDYGIRSIRSGEWEGIRVGLDGWTPRHREVSGLYRGDAFRPPHGGVVIVFPVFAHSDDWAPRRVRFREAREGPNVRQVRGGTLLYPFNGQAVGGPTDDVWVGEGELDILPLMVWGLTVVAIPGVGATASMDWIIERLEHAPSVRLAFDGDRAGRKAAAEFQERLFRRWGEEWFAGNPNRLLRVRPADGLDLNDLVGAGWQP